MKVFFLKINLYNRRKIAHSSSKFFHTLSSFRVFIFKYCSIVGDEYNSKVFLFQKSLQNVHIHSIFQKNLQIMSFVPNTIRDKFLWNVYSNFAQIFFSVDFFQNVNIHRKLSLGSNVHFENESLRNSFCWTEEIQKFFKSILSNWVYIDWK